MKGVLTGYVDNPSSTLGYRYFLPSNLRRFFSGPGFFELPTKPVDGPALVTIRTLVTMEPTDPVGPNVVGVLGIITNPHLPAIERAGDPFAIAEKYGVLFDRIQAVLGTIYLKDRPAGVTAFEGDFASSAYILPPNSSLTLLVDVAGKTTAELDVMIVPIALRG